MGDSFRSRRQIGWAIAVLPRQSRARTRRLVFAFAAALLAAPSGIIAAQGQPSPAKTFLIEPPTPLLPGTLGPLRHEGDLAPDLNPGDGLGGVDAADSAVLNEDGLKRFARSGYGSDQKESRPLLTLTVYQFRDASGAVAADGGIGAGQVQPASLDLRLGRRAWRVRASFLPRPGGSVAARIGDVAMHELDLSAGAVLERGCVYIAELRESLALPAGVGGRANPKSSTGRIDIFVRLLTDGQPAFDDVVDGYRLARAALDADLAKWAALKAELG